MTAPEGCPARSVVREAREEGLFGAREAAMVRSRGLGAESGVQGRRRGQCGGASQSGDSGRR